jgi:membrane protein implicated in regulation of membrane protease activity
MHSGVKLIIGIIIFLAGIYWYVATFITPGLATTWIGMAALSSLKTVFIGVFGLVLIVLGLIVAWIEYEDIKWERKEKREQKVEEKPVEVKAEEKDTKPVRTRKVRAK